jgi:metal-dependent amidase/aminoacylase/carboxypeptidase family protein
MRSGPSALVADHLKRLGMDVVVNVAHTGVVGLLKGKKFGKRSAGIIPGRS